MGGDTWPFLVGGVIFLVKSFNKRDPCLLCSSTKRVPIGERFLEGRTTTIQINRKAITGL